MQYSKKFISIDLETTDLRDGRIMEVGAVEVELKWNEKDQRIETVFGKSFETLINPEVEVPQTALAITGITQEELNSAPLWKDTHKQFKAFLKDHLLLGHNIGFDLQYLANQGLKLKNKYADPEVEVPQTALAITGITQEELNSAPLWKDTHKQFKAFLKDHLLLGHNIGFDLQYLANQGLKLKNKYADTLETAQTFLPLCESHSLEFLVGHFNLPSLRSHRGLDDSKSAGYLLASVLNEFLTLPGEPQKRIKSRIFDFLPGFRDLFANLPVITIQKEQTSAVVSTEPAPKKFQKPIDWPDRAILSLPLSFNKQQECPKKFQKPIDWPDRAILSLPLSFNKQQEWLQELAQTPEKAIIGLSHEVYLNAVPEEQRITPPRQALCEKRLNWLANQDKLAETAAKVLIKTLIFREKTASLDLSLVKWTVLEREILGIIACEPNVCKKHQCAYARSLKLEEGKPYFAKSLAVFDLVSDWKVDFSSRRLLLFDLSDGEDNFTESLKRVWNLNKIRRQLQIIYPINSATPSFYSKVPEEVETVANELDLFFGILHLVYRKKEYEFSENIIIDEKEQDSERFTKLIHPAEKLRDKLGKFSEFIESRILVEDEELEGELENLRIKISEIKLFLDEFFSSSLSVSNISWLKFDSETVDLNTAPRDLTGHWTKFQKQFKGTSIVDTVLPKMSLMYYQKRLGLQNFVAQRIAEPDGSETIKINIASKPVPSKNLELFWAGLKGSSVIIVPNETKLSEIFETFSKSAMPRRLILAYKHSGSLSSLKSRLAAQAADGKSDLVLLLTTSAFFRFFLRLPKAEHLVILRLPFEAPGTKPAVLSDGPYENFSDHILPRAVHQLHVMLTRFAACPGKSKSVYLLDPRVSTDYNQEFIKYLREFPDFVISTIDPPLFS